MKRMLFLLFVFVTVSAFTFAQDGFFSTRGKEVVDGTGKPILLKGINLGNWLVPEGYMFHFKKISSPRLIYNLFNILLGEDEANKFWDVFRDNYITKADIHYIKSIGLNSVRIPFNYRLFIREYPYREISGAGYELLDKVVQWCKEENLYVVLDMHCAPGGQTGDNIDDSFGYPFLFESPESQQITIDIWKKLASKYKDEKIIIGYDLLNEPIAHYFDAETTNPKLEPLYKRITEAIRTVDKNHIIFLGGAQWNTNFKCFGKPFDDKLVYTFHKYWMDPVQKEVQEYIDFSEKYNVPIWMGESGENTNEWISTFRTMLENNNIGWCFWTYKKMKNERGIVSINQPENFDLIIDFSELENLYYGTVRDNRPDYQKIKTAFDNYLINCKFENCEVNRDYIKALGF